MNIVFNSAATSKSALTEAGQTMKVEFTWLQKLDANTFESQTPWMLCRDYLNEIFAKLYSGGKMDPHKVFGFDISNLDVRGEDRDWFYLGISYKEDSKACPLSFKKFFKTLQSIEDANGFEQSAILHHSEKEKYFIVRGDRKWLNNTVLLNIYTWNLRMAFYKPDSDSWFNKHPYEGLLKKEELNTYTRVKDVQYLRGVGRYIDLKTAFYNYNIWSDMKQPTPNLDSETMYEEKNKYILHDCSGLFALANKLQVGQHCEFGVRCFKSQERAAA